VVTAGVHDALGARILQDAGFELAYMSGNATTASRLGKPDIGLLTLTEMLDHARGITSAIEIPLLCDSDAGYGGKDNIARTVQCWEQAGVAGIHIEDQVVTKRCGAMPGLQLVDTSEAVERIKTALKARQDKDFMIIGRTDAIPVYGLDEAMRRAWSYFNAGADMVYIENFQSREQMEIVGREFASVPLMGDVFETWPWTVIPKDELAQMGFNLVFYPLTATFAIAKVLQEVFSAINRAGCSGPVLDKLTDRHEYERLLGIHETAMLGGGNNGS